MLKSYEICKINSVSNINNLDVPFAFLFTWSVRKIHIDIICGKSTTNLYDTDYRIARYKLQSLHNGKNAKSLFLTRCVYICNQYNNLILLQNPETLRETSDKIIY